MTATVRAAMPPTFPPDSVGQVIPQTAHFAEALALDCGRMLDACELVYETYGTLNADHSNAWLLYTSRCV